MRTLAASIVLGPLMLIGALAASAGPSTPAFGSDAPIHLVSSGDRTADRDTFKRQAWNDTQEWQYRLYNFNETAKANGHKAGAEAENELNQAWTDYRAAARNLRTVGDDGWKSTKTSYVQASRDLANAWDKIRPENR